MTIQISVSEDKIIPFIENIDSYYFNYENNNILPNTSTIILDNIEDGIIINCLPSINNISFPKSNFFQNKLTFFEKNKKGYIKNSLQNDFRINQINQKQQIIEKNLFFNDNKNSYNIIDILSSNENKSYTSFLTLYDSYLKNDIKLESFLGINNLFNDSLLNYPNVISILNNEIEKQLLNFEINLLNYYIYYINYPINHSSYFNFNEGIHLEPFSISNVLQFKSKQEFEMNQFQIDIDQSKNSRNYENVFIEKVQNNTNFTSFFDNINSNDNFLIKSSYQEIDSYIEKVLEDPITNTIFDSLGNLTKNYKSKVKDSNNKKTVYRKNFISSNSYIFSDYKNNLLKPFNDNDKNIIYSSQNYNDLTFKEIFKNNKLIENIRNRQSNVYYEKNEKFSSCGFDWSYTNSIGKNSIAFKGLE